MNNFFQPQTTNTMPTIENYATGAVWTANDIFRNLFSHDRYTDSHFGTQDETNAMHDMKMEINNIVWGSAYKVGEASQEVFNMYNKEVLEMIEFLLFNAERSPLLKFKRTWRGLLTKKEFTSFGLVEVRKGLDVDFLESLLNIELPQEFAAYAERFCLEGEAGDWYFKEYGSEDFSSMCFASTQIQSLAAFVRRVLGVQCRANEMANNLFAEGHDAEHVTERLNKSFGTTNNVIIERAIGAANKAPKMAAAFREYGTWVVDFEEDKTGRVKRARAKGSEVFKFNDQQEARTWATARNNSEKADRKHADNIKRIEELKAELARCEELMIELGDESEEAYIAFKKLARPLQSS